MTKRDPAESKSLKVILSAHLSQAGKPQEREHLVCLWNSSGLAIDNGSLLITKMPAMSNAVLDENDAHDRGLCVQQQRNQALYSLLL